VCKGVDKCTGVVCKAKSQCHTPGACVYATGVCTNPFAPTTLKCDDKDPKTGEDKCNGAGICKGRDLCAGKKIKCTALNQCHTAGVCESGTGKCSNPMKKLNSKCDDKNKNTANDKCVALSATTMECRGTPIKDECKGKAKCVSKGPCFSEGKCFPGTGKCSYVPRKAGTACDDKNPLTGDDRCDGKGSCKGRNLCYNKKCPLPENSCIASKCNSGTGKCQNSFKKVGTVCDDDQPKTTGDKCV
jgi:hypothetical protein